MSEQEHVRTVQEIYAAFGRGDIPFILEKLTDDVRWMSYMESVVPWAGDFSEKQRVPEFFASISRSVVVESFTPQEFLAQAETVVSIGEFGCRVLATGKSSLTRWVFIWRFRNGLVCGYEQFHDPSIANAFR